MSNNSFLSKLVNYKGKGDRNSTNETSLALSSIARKISDIPPIDESSHKFIISAKYNKEKFTSSKVTIQQALEENLSVYMENFGNAEYSDSHRKELSYLMYSIINTDKTRIFSSSQYLSLYIVLYSFLPSSKALLALNMIFLNLENSYILTKKEKLQKRKKELMLESILSLFNYLSKTHSEINTFDKMFTGNIDKLPLLKFVNVKLTRLFDSFKNLNKEELLPLLELLIFSRKDPLMLLLHGNLSYNKKNIKSLKSSKMQTTKEDLLFIQLDSMLTINSGKMLKEMLKLSKEWENTKDYEFFMRYRGSIQWDDFLSDKISMNTVRHSIYKDESVIKEIYNNSSYRTSFKSDIWDKLLWKRQMDGPSNKSNSADLSARTSQDNKKTVGGTVNNTMYKELSDYLSANLSLTKKSESQKPRERQSTIIKNFKFTPEDFIANQLLYWGEFKLKASSSSKKTERRDSYDDNKVIVKRNVAKKNKMQDLVSYSCLTEYLNLPCLFMEGYLYRIGKGMFNKKILKRGWYSLKGNYISIFKTSESKLPRNDECFCLLDSEIEESESLDKEQRYGIRITLRNESDFLEFFTNDFEYKEKWIGCLKSAAKNYSVII
eukprot:GAHX01001923.1.p1 GENE.GAHX01001923.1~~GAHX01001923.1.p1  ORF type:complete len:606 (-),score=111.05 GAHX01001923.1:23-1840(-)